MSKNKLISNPFQSFLNNYGDGYASFEKVFLSIDEVFRTGFMIRSLDSSLMPSISMFFMDNHPEKLLELADDMKFDFFKIETDIRKVILHYRPEMNHELVEEFKMKLIQEYNLKEKQRLWDKVKYLHSDVPIINSNAVEKCESTAIKGNWHDFQEYLIGITDNVSYDSKLLFDIIYDNPEVISEMILPEGYSYFFKSAFSRRFIESTTDNPQTMTLLKVYMKYYSSKPGVYDGVYIYPGMRLNDPDMGFIKFLMKEKVIKVIDSFAIINTIILTQTDPEILEKN